MRPALVEVVADEDRGRASKRDELSVALDARHHHVERGEDLRRAEQDFLDVRLGLLAALCERQDVRRGAVEVQVQASRQGRRTGVQVLGQLGHAGRFSERGNDAVFQRLNAEGRAEAAGWGGPRLGRPATPEPEPENRTERHGNLLPVRGLQYHDRIIAPGAQTERRGEAELVRTSRLRLYADHHGGVATQMSGLGATGWAASPVCRRALPCRPRCWLISSPVPRTAEAAAVPVVAPDAATAAATTVPLP